MHRRNSNRETSHWINARYPGRCHCGKEIRPGDRAMYYPTSKKLACPRCGWKSELEVTEDDIRAALKVR
jgi:hypothetical protein